MAYQISVQGNFFIVYDDVARIEVIHYPRSQTNFYFNDIDSTFEFLGLGANVRKFAANGLSKFDFADLRDKRTGLAWVSTDELNEFLNLNLGGTNNPVQVLKTTGWASYVDDEYTIGSPFSVSADTDTLLPNNAATVIDSQKPIDVETFYTEGKLFFTSLTGTFEIGEEITGATSGATALVQYQNTNYLYLRTISGTFTDTETITGITSGATASVDGTISDSFITGREGDNLDCMLYFKAVPSASSQYVQMWVDIGGSIGELYRQSYSFPKGAGTARGILYSLPSAYTLNTWEANGGKIYVNSDASLDIYDINFNFDRSHKANS